jgi:hypothetical protein
MVGVLGFSEQRIAVWILTNVAERAFVNIVRAVRETAGLAFCRAYSPCGPSDLLWKGPEQVKSIDIVITAAFIMKMWIYRGAKVFVDITSTHVMG